MVSDRLLLRRWTGDDRAPFAALNSDPDVMEHFAAPLSRADSDAFVDRIEAAFERDGIGLWAVEVTATGEFVGFTGLWRVGFDSHFTPAVEIGWRFARRAWGQGYASEAARVALAYAFDRAGLDEVVSFTARSNVRSQAVMRRIGMVHDAADDFDHPRLADGHPLRGHVLYRLPASRWAAVASFVRTATAGLEGAAARPALFRAVRDLPYATNAATTAEELVRWRRGGCWAKADLLARGLCYLGYDARRVWWRYLLPDAVPEVRLLPSREDVHAAVEVRVDGARHVVDPTLDPPLARLGLRVTEWDGSGDTDVAFVPSGPVWREGRHDAEVESAIRWCRSTMALGSGDLSRYPVAYNRWLEMARH